MKAILSSFAWEWYSDLRGDQHRVIELGICWLLQIPINAFDKQSLKALLEFSHKCIADTAILDSFILDRQRLLKSV